MLVMMAYPDPLICWTLDEQTLGNWLIQHCGPRRPLTELRDELENWYEDAKKVKRSRPQSDQKPDDSPHRRFAAWVDENGRMKTVYSPNPLVEKVARHLCEACGVNPDLPLVNRPERIEHVTFRDAAVVYPELIHPAWEHQALTAIQIIKMVQQAGPGVQQQ